MKYVGWKSYTFTQCNSAVHCTCIFPSLPPHSLSHTHTHTHRVDSELDLIKTQQEELEELLSDLEKELDQTPTSGVGVHYADMQRTKT